ncbi:MAG: nitric oxide reductase, partial [Bradyrhizobium sp.]
MDEIGEDELQGHHHVGVRTILHPETHEAMNYDPVNRVLKWVLLATAIACFIIIALATRQQYHDAPPLPDQFVAIGGGLVMSGDNIVAGKADFQKADLIDYGSLYGMGSYFGPDYTADTLVALAIAVQDNLAQKAAGTLFASLDADKQAAIRSHMQAELHGVDLTQDEVTVSTALADAIASVREAIATKLLQSDPSEGYSKARSLDAVSAGHTADFLIYSALTTVAYRPNSTVSWTQNWPYEPIVGNSPTTSTFIWTWVSFCFVFFGFGAVLAIYKIFLSNPDVSPMDPVLSGFQALTPSQRKTGKYFVFVAAMLLVQIGAGTIMGHYYTDRASFYGVPVGEFLPFNFLRSVHTQAPLIWIAFAWIGSGLFIAPAVSGYEAKHQALLVDILFWVSLVVVAGALIGNYLGIMGVINALWFWFGNQGLPYLEIGRFWQIAFFLA